MNEIRVFQFGFMKNTSFLGGMFHLALILEIGEN